MQPIIELSELHKDYGSGDIAVHALRGVNLILEQGAFAALAGPSGSGKSTLLNIIGGLDKPTRGQAKIAGQDVAHLSDRALSKMRLFNIGFVFQAYNLLPVLTAYENAEYVLMLQGVAKQERRDRVMPLLQEVGLEGMENRFPKELSGGQQQRVAIARAIVTNPRLVLADEPTANLDSKTGGRLIDLMHRLNQEKAITFLFSTHDPNVLKRADDLILIADGLITYHGPTKEQPASEYHAAP